MPTSSIHVRLAAWHVGLIVARDLLLFDVPAQIALLSTTFHVPYTSWISHPGAVSSDLAFLALVISAAAALFLSAGRWPRLAAGWLLMVYGYRFFADQLGYSNNGYLLLTLLTLLVVTGRADGQMNRYFKRAVQALCCVVYWGAGHVKLESF